MIMLFQLGLPIIYLGLILVMTLCSVFYPQLFLAPTFRRHSSRAAQLHASHEDSGPSSVLLHSDLVYSFSLYTTMTQHYSSVR